MLKNFTFSAKNSHQMLHCRNAHVFLRKLPRFSPIIRESGFCMDWSTFFMLSRVTRRHHKQIKKVDGLMLKSPSRPLKVEINPFCLFDPLHHCIWLNLSRSNRK